jgi:hypothetical protein
MRAFLRRRFWKILTYRLGVLGVGFVYLLAALEIPLPLPVMARTDGGQPFPCQNHPCGCRTAEQCWSHCCCFTAEERWAWAKANNVEPPAYAEKPVVKPAVNGWNSVKLRDRARNETASKSCCRAKAEPASCCQSTNRSATATPTSSRCRSVTAFSAWRCQGYSTLWVSIGAVLPAPPLAAWRPDCSPSMRVALFSVKADRVPLIPLDPPPRRSLV